MAIPWIESYSVNIYLYLEWFYLIGIGLGYGLKQDQSFQNNRIFGRFGTFALKYTGYEYPIFSYAKYRNGRPLGF